MIAQHEDHCCEEMKTQLLHLLKHKQSLYSKI